MPDEAPQSLSSLIQRSTIDDHEEILRACNTALKKKKTNVEAQHAKAIALLKLDRYDDAARFFDETGSELQTRAPLEHSYTLYKTAKPREAAEIASKLSGNHGARHVEAQALYRAEDFAKVAELYDRLSEMGFASEAHDLRINKSAVEAQIHWKDSHTLQRRRPGREDLGVFETAYNVACTSIAMGELAQAEVLLCRAKELCLHSDELSAADKAAELLPIKIQQIYVLERLGKVAEAEQIASEVDPDNVFDLSTRQIACNNVLLVKRDLSNPFIRNKLFNSTPKISAYDRPFTYQSRLLNFNANTLNLEAFKYDGVAEVTSKAILHSSSSATSSETTSLAVLNAAAHARNVTGKEALKKILPILEQRPNDVGLVMTIVQLYLSTNNPTSAVNMLESFLGRLEKSTTEDQLDIRFSPGLIATLVALYKTQGRRSDLKQELARASSYWRHRSKAPQLLLKAAGLALLESGDSNDILAAEEIFEIVKEQNPEDKSANAGLVAAMTARSQPESLSGVEKLTPISKLTSGIDMDSLDRSGIPQSSNALALAQQRTSRKRPVDGNRPKSKRIRKSRFPKDYEPGKTPDPERWLPLRDRSNYRPKGKKKGRKDGGDRTQGGMVADDVGIKDAGASKVQSAGAVLGGGGGNKKKKGKGKK